MIARGVKDLAGNVLAAEHRSSSTTAALSPTGKKVYVPLVLKR